ncbi:MAG: AbrB/MazE/SpoVT family DNA-binding domain-containing protein [Bacilli bacterium]
MKFEKGSCLCGSVKVGERGQVVIPKKARDFFNIGKDEELLVIADSEIGVTIIKADSVGDLSRKLELYEKKYGEG